MDPSWRASGQEAVVAIAELMETFRETEQICPGFCDNFLDKLNNHIKTHLIHLSEHSTSINRPSLPSSMDRSNITKSSIS